MMTDIARRLAIPADAIEPFGFDAAKPTAEFLASLPKPQGKLVLVTAVSPTPAGEGKTTTSIGLADGLSRLGVKVALCLREPSLGPVFGMKGGATGSGKAQLVPGEDINLHFTGDLHAITAAHNLLAAMVDNHLHFRLDPQLDARRITWSRAVDMNDRALRRIVLGLGGPGDGVPREGRFDITAASEVMAVLCLARDPADLAARLARIVVGESADKRMVRAEEIGAVGAMARLLKTAIRPNLVRTLEGTPALVHGGPFANIAHGCNSVIATRMGLALADVVVTEAGFGADLGAEKFVDIKCRQAGLAPSLAVIVATVKSVAHHGGPANLVRHIQNVTTLGMIPVVAINRFADDEPAQLKAIERAAEAAGARAILAEHWAKGGEGALDLAREVVDLVNAPAPALKPLYDDAMALSRKVETVATKIYRAARVEFAPAAREALKRFEQAGFGGLPVCIAKTPASFTADAKVLGAPEGFVLPIAGVRLSAGAGFVVALAGEISTMPGLPRQPSALAFNA